ncbi:MAG TPA: universal stress protein [Terriglobales bacterium]|nr:universal stress protein [Terriglobales bacterium]
MSPAVTASSVSLQNILFATDFSPCSETALPFAAGLARRYGATLYTVNVIREERGDVHPLDSFYLRHTAEKNMARLVKTETVAGIKHRELLREGKLSQVLTALIRTLAVDVVVMGTHGRGGVAKLLLGSVAERIVGSAPCPVLTIGPHVSGRSEPELKLQRILFATDLAPGPEKALSYALWLAEHEQAHLTVLQVQNVSSGSGRDIVLKRLVQPLPAEMPETDFVVEIGGVAEHILRAAEARGVDLIVMGLHHTPYVRLSAHLPWVTTHQVLSRASCPVLTAPCPAAL